jgi:hypothetical protein
MKVKLRKVMHYSGVHREDSRLLSVYKLAEMSIAPTEGMVIKFGNESLHVSHVTYDIDRELLLVTESRVCSEQHNFEPIVNDWKKQGWNVETDLYGNDAFFKPRFENLCVHDDIKWDQLKK